MFVTSLVPCSSDMHVPAALVQCCCLKGPNYSCLRNFCTFSCLTGLNSSALGTYAFLAASKVLMLLPQGLTYFWLPQRSYFCCLRDLCTSGCLRGLNAASSRTYALLPASKVLMLLIITCTFPCAMMHLTRSACFSPKVDARSLTE